MKRKTDNLGNKGFTLVELIVVLVMVVNMVSDLFGSIRSLFSL